MKNSQNIVKFPLTLQEVAQYLPQKDPFLMVSELIATSDELTISNFEIKSDNILLENGLLSESGLIENMAQTALLGAIFNSNGSNITVRNAWLVTIEKLEIFNLPNSGSVIYTHTSAQSFAGFSVVSGKVLLEDKEIASCKMKVIHSDTYKN